MEPQQPAAAPRSAAQLLIDPVFGRFFWTKVLSLSGIWAQNIAAAIVMWELTGSATLVGAITAAQFSGVLLLGPFAGALTDVFDRRRMLMAGRVVSGAAALVLATVPLMGGTLTARLVISMSAVLGLGLALSAPALQALVPALTPPEDLDQAIALNSVVGNIARTVGPALGAGMMMMGGAPAAFGMAAFGHLVFALALIGLVPPTPRAAQGNRRILDGLRYLRQDPKMALLLLGTAALSFGIDPIVTLTPALATELGADDTAVGIMASTFGAGAVIAATLIGTLRRHLGLRRIGVIGFGVLTGGLLLVAASPALSFTLIGFGTAGAGFLLATTALTTRIQRRVPEALRGRVMAIWTIAFLGFRPIAAAVNGLVADAINVRTAILLGACITIASSFAARVSYHEAWGDRAARP